MKSSLSNFSRKHFFRVWWMAVIGMACGFGLVMVARNNVDGFLGRLGASVGLLSCLAAFLAFLAYLLGRAKAIGEKQNVR